MTSPTPPRRRWFRYGLRTFFVVLTIFGVWLGVQVKWIRDRHERMNRSRPAFNIPSNHAAPWSLRILGEKGVSFIYVSPDTNTPEARKLKQLFPEAQLYPALE